MGVIDQQIVGYTAYSQGTPKMVEVMDSSTILLTPNPLRLFVQINNNSLFPIFIKYQFAAEFGQGTPLAGNSSIYISEGDLHPFQISAITTPGHVALVEVIEGV